MKITLIQVQNITLAVFLAVFFIQCSGSNIKDNSKPRVRLCINKMDAEGADKKIAARLANILNEKLQELKGTNKVVFRDKDGVSKSTNRQLIGRISKLGQKFVLTIKVIEGEKGKLLFNETTIVNQNDLDDTIKDIAENISDKESIW